MTLKDLIARADYYNTDLKHFDVPITINGKEVIIDFDVKETRGELGLKKIEAVELLIFSKEKKADIKI